MLGLFIRFTLFSNKCYCVAQIGATSEKKNLKRLNPKKSVLKMIDFSFIEILKLVRSCHINYKLIYISQKISIDIPMTNLPKGKIGAKLWIFVDFN